MDRTDPATPELDLLTGTADLTRLATWQTPPTSPPSAPKPLVKVQWASSDAGSGIHHYLVHSRSRPANGTFGPWTVESVNQPRLTIQGARGATYCFKVIAVDAAAPAPNNSEVSDVECSTVALNENTFALTGAWQFVGHPDYYLNRYRRTFTDGATMTTPQVGAGRWIVMYATCPTCGKLRVFANGVAIATINTNAATVKTKRQLLGTQVVSPSATIKVAAVLTPGQEVRIEAIGVSAP